MPRLSRIRLAFHSLNDPRCIPKSIHEPCVSLFKRRKKTQRNGKTNEKKRFEMQIRARAINIVFVEVFFLFLVKQKTGRARRLKKVFMYLRWGEIGARRGLLLRELSAHSIRPRHEKRKGKAINFSSFISNACRHETHTIPRTNKVKSRRNRRKIYSI